MGKRRHKTHKQGPHRLVPAAARAGRHPDRQPRWWCSPLWAAKLLHETTTKQSAACLPHYLAAGDAPRGRTPHPTGLQQAGSLRVHAHTVHSSLVYCDPQPDHAAMRPLQVGPPKSQNALCPLTLWPSMISGMMSYFQEGSLRSYSLRTSELYTPAPPCSSCTDQSRAARVHAIPWRLCLPHGASQRAEQPASQPVVMRTGHQEQTGLLQERDAVQQARHMLPAAADCCRGGACSSPSPPPPPTTCSSFSVLRLSPASLRALAASTPGGMTGGRARLSRALGTATWMRFTTSLTRLP